MKRTSFLHRLTLFTLLCAAGMLQATSASAVSTYSVIVDDYAAPSTWQYSRIGTNRGVMGNKDNGIDTYAISIANGGATATVTDGWGGIWTSLLHLASDNDQLDPVKVFGPYIKPAWQGQITGVEADVQGSAQDTPFKIELLDANRVVQYTQPFILSGVKQKVTFAVTPIVPLKLLNWLVTDADQSATVDEIRLLVSTPDLTPEQAIFLFSYGHLSQCYNPDTGLVRDQAYYPANDSLALQSTGMFALATAAAYQLGYVEKSIAEEIVKKTTAALKALPVCHGLKPHIITNGDIAPGSEWSSIDTVISLTADLLAAQYLNLSTETSDMEALLKAVDWSDLTDGYTNRVGMGYNHDGTKISYRWGSFGSELFLIAAAFSAANPDKIIVNDEHPYPPTWDGSGFIDELAALFFPMNGSDYWGDDWNKYRCSAFNKQLAYFEGKPEYSGKGLFGLSACEAPEKWEVAGNTYWPWGVGGHNGLGPIDGSATIPGCFGADCPPVVGYPIVSPHYAAMTCKEHPSACRKMFNYLISQHRFSPLNNTESAGIKDSDLKWSDSKGSWNLSMQALGAARALSGNDFAPYKALQHNAFLLASYNKLMPKQGGAPCSAPIPFVYKLLLKQ